MAFSTIDLPGAGIALDPAWLDATAATGLFDTLESAIGWEQHRVRLFGRDMDSPRLSCWIGDPDATYRYSGISRAPQPWPAALLALRQRLAREVGIDVNSVLANLYRDGRDAMGWHSDDEPELGPRPVIASLSLGGVRRFVLKPRRRPEVKHAIELPHGSLLLMHGDTQRHYRHALPRTARPVAARINLTFRRIEAAG